MVGIGPPIDFEFGEELRRVDVADDLHGLVGGIAQGRIDGFVEVVQVTANGGQRLGFGLVILRQDADSLAFYVRKGGVDLPDGQGVIDRLLGRKELVAGDIVAVDAVEKPRLAGRRGIAGGFAVGAEDDNLTVRVTVADPGDVLEFWIVGDVLDFIQHVHVDSLGLAEAVVEAADLDEDFVVVPGVFFIGCEVNRFTEQRAEEL